MSVEFVAAATVHELMAHLRDTRARTSEEAPPDLPQSAAYWERLFEAHAAAVLGVLGRVQLAPDYAVRYRFYGRRGADLLVRPFIARATTDVSLIRQLLDWHPAPDSIAPSLRSRPNQDIELLYRHFNFERSPAGYFEYWVAMQELWASTQWVHSSVIADAEAFARITGREGWQIDRPVERFEPAVVAGEDGAQLAVLLHCPLEREVIGLRRVHIEPDQSIQFVEAIAVARGPRGYTL